MKLHAIPDRLWARRVESAGILTAGLGLFALGAWIFDRWQLSTFGADHVPMAPSTAVLFILLGLALGALHRWPMRSLVSGGSRGVAGLTIAAGLTVLLQEWPGWSLPWADWLPDAGRKLGAIPLGRMSPLTAAAFVLSAVALLILTGRPPQTKRRQTAATVSAGTAFFLGLVVVLGYGAGTPLLYGGVTVPMALLTAIGFLALNAGLLVFSGLFSRVADWMDGGVEPATLEDGDRFKGRLAFFLIGLLLAISLAGFYYQRHRQTVARDLVYRNLDAIADLKAGQVVNWRRNRLGDGQFLSQAPFVAADVAALLANPGSTEVRAKVIQWLALISNSDRYVSARIFDAGGNLRLTVPETDEPSDPADSVAVREAVRRNFVALGRLRRTGRDGAISLDLQIPVAPPTTVPTDRPGLKREAPAAIIFLRIDPKVFLFPLVQSWPTPSETAETLLVRREGDDVVFLTEPRHRPGTALTLSRSIADSQLPAVAGVLGPDAVFEGLDYRGMPVLAATRAIPDSPWVIVAKMDTAEAYASIRADVWRTGALVGLLLGLVTLTAVYLWRQRHARLLQRELLLEREHQRMANITQLQGAALAAAANAIVITDREGTVVWANRAFSALTGYAKGEAIGRNPRDLVKSGEQDEAFYRRMWDTLLAGRVWHGELINRRKDGTHYPEEMTITPVRDTAGEITHFVAIKQDLTERRKAEEALRESEFRLRESQAIAGVGSYVLDVVSGRWTSSDVLNWIFGIGPDFERTVAGWLALVHPEEQASMTEYFARDVLERGRMFNREYRIIRQTDRVERWVSGIGRLTFDAQGRVTRMVGTIQDVTERKQAEAALQREQALFVDLITTIPDYIYFKDRQSRFVRINTSLARNFGLRSPAEAAGRTDADYFGEEHARQSYEDEQRIMSTGKPMIGVEEKETWPDGRVTWASSTKMPLRDESGKIVGLVGISRDVTERRIAERQLQEQAVILSKSHEGVMIVNLANQITHWNKGAERMFGWPAAEALGRLPEDVLGIDEVGVVPNLRQAVASEGFWNGEIKVKSRDGQALRAAFRITLVRDEAGQPVARLSFISDVTEQRLLEEKFLHAQRLESIGMLAAGIAHDLNNVLAPIVFATPMLRSNLTSDRDLKILDTVESSAQRGAGLVKQILGFVRKASGEFQAIQVKHLARDIFAVMEETFPKAIELRQEIPSDIWPVLGNATQIHQVLMNLCVNARDAMPDGGRLTLQAVNRRLTEAEAAGIDGAAPGNWLQLAVTDTGTGIAPEVREKIWTPFFTTKDVGKGTGLGLTTIRSIVANHHGFVTLETAPGRGTTFRVFLPAVEEMAAPEQKAGAGDEQRGRGELVLVVDDDEAIRNLIAAILKKFGYRVTTCDDGVEALNLFTSRAADFNLLITDVDMPRVGGLALVHGIREIRPDMRVLVISGLTHDEAATPEGPDVRSQVQGFLPKPFTVERLLAAVHQALLDPVAGGGA